MMMKCANSIYHLGWSLHLFSTSFRTSSNAPAESFFATLKLEKFDGLEIKDLDAAKYYAWYFIEIMYNNKRSHSTLGYVTPCQFEGAYIRNQQAG